MRLLETLNVDALPTTGGLSPTVVVTIPLSTLMGGPAAAAILGTSTLLPPGEARAKRGLSADAPIRAGTASLRNLPGGRFAPEGKVPPARLSSGSARAALRPARPRL